MCKSTPGLREREWSSRRERGKSCEQLSKLYENCKVFYVAHIFTTWEFFTWCDDIYEELKLNFLSLFLHSGNLKFMIFN